MTDLTALRGGYFKMNGVKAVAQQQQNDMSS